MLRKVLLPQRIKSDVVDGAISSSLMLVPMYVVYGYADYLAEAFQRLSIAGIPLALLYLIFRDSIGKGTSLGKKALGLIIVDLKTGRSYGVRRDVCYLVMRMWGYQSLQK
jgi:hypothetical protein